MTSITFFFIFIPLLAVILLAVNLIFAPHNPYQEKDSAFECGFHSFLGQNRTQFSISFFIFALLFLLFDLEILLVYPYVVSAYTNGIYGLAIMLIFFLALTLGFAFELGKNALKIDSRQMIKLVNKQSNSTTFISSMRFYNISKKSFTKTFTLVNLKIVISSMIIAVFMISVVSVFSVFTPWGSQELRLKLFGAHCAGNDDKVDFTNNPQSEFEIQTKGWTDKAKMEKLNSDRAYWVAQNINYGVGRRALGKADLFEFNPDEKMVIEEIKRQNEFSAAAINEAVRDNKRTIAEIDANMETIKAKASTSSETSSKRSADSNLELDSKRNRN